MQLSEQEVAHLAACKRCVGLMDEFTAARDLDGWASSASNRIDHFFNEAELTRIKLKSVEELQLTTSREAAAAQTQPADSATSVGVGNNEPRSPEPFLAPKMQAEQLQRCLPDDRYHVQSLIASGGIGSVFLAFDKKLSREVAIKILSGGSIRDRQRLQREAASLAEIEHPNVVKIFDIGRLEGEPQDSPSNGGGGIKGRSAEFSAAPYLVMEYVADGTAGDLPKCENLEQYQALAVLLAGAARGLAAAHARGLIHRDVKPSNLLYDRAAPLLKVADFGLAKFSDSKSTLLTLSEEIVGTPAFMSPEQIGVAERSPSGHADSSRHLDGSHGLTASTDVYSLGATLYMLLTGKPPLLGSTAAVLRQIPETQPVEPRVLNPSIPLDLETICLRAMEKRPRDRYPTMQALADDLERFAGGQPTVARPLSRAAKVYRWASRNKLLASCLVIVGLLTVTLAIGSASVAGILWKQNQTILASRQRAVEELCSKIALAGPGALPLAIAQLIPERQEVMPYLQRLWDESRDPQQRMNLACALTMLGDGRYDYLVDHVASSPTTPEQCALLCDAFSTQPALSLGLIGKKFDGSSEPLERYKLAIVALQLGDEQLYAALESKSPDTRTELIHLLPKWHGDLVFLAKIVDDSKSPNLSASICLAMGLMEPTVLNVRQRELWSNTLAKIEERPQTADVRVAGLRSAARWLAERHGLTQPEVSVPPETLASAASEIRSPTLKMVRIPAGEFLMGSDDNLEMRATPRPQRIKLTRDFWLAEREISVGLFRTFLEAQASQAKADDVDGPQVWQPDPIISPTDEHPAQQLTWSEAIRFCNWLSAEHGFDAVYRRSGLVESASDDRNSVGLEDWRIEPLADGYRLPTEAEFEYACRAGTQTRFSFGDNMQYLSDYAAWSNNTRIASSPCGALMPNPWGLFDMHGNVWEWCQDDFGDASATEGTAESRFLGHVFRGGGVCTFTGYPFSSCRGGAASESRYNNLGFRVARNAETP